MAHPNPAELPGPDAFQQPTAEGLRLPEILLASEGEKKVIDSVWLRGSDKVYVSGPTSIDITVGTEKQKMQVFETEEQLWEFVLREGFVFDHIRGGRSASSRVIDLASARERRQEQEKAGDPMVEVQAVVTEIEQVMGYIRLKEAAVADSLEQIPYLKKVTGISMNERSLTEYADRKQVLADLMESLTLTDDILDAEANEFDAEDAEALGNLLQKKREILADFKKLLANLEVLLLDVNNLVSADTAPVDKAAAVTQAAGKSKESAGTPKKGSGEAAPEKKKTPRKGKGGGSDDGGGGEGPDDQKAGGVVPVAPEAAEEADIAWRKELDVFRGRFERAARAYQGMIAGEWRRFLEATFPLGKVFTEEKQLAIWNTELLPRIRKSILEDIVGRGIDPEKAEEVISAILRELDEERTRKMAEKEAARVRKAEEKRAQASLDKQSTT